MRFFNFAWLNSKEREALEEFRNKQKEYEGVSNYEIMADEPFTSTTTSTTSTTQAVKPYQSVRIVGNEVIVTLRDGVTLTFPDVDYFEKVKTCPSEGAILDMYKASLPNYKECKEDDLKGEELKEQEQIKKYYDCLKGHPDFTIEGDRVYFKDIKLALPPAVAASFIELIERMEVEQYSDIQEDLTLPKQYAALSSFWLKLCRSGRKESRDQLLTFCKRNDIRISPLGSVIAYRKVVKWKETKGNEKLIQFVNEQYDLIKKRKKSPLNYWIWELLGSTEATYILDRGNTTLPSGKWSNLGNVHYLKQNLKPEKGGIWYTSKHSKGKYVFQIGDVYQANEDDIDLDATVCHSGGLHFASVSYNYGGYGDTPVVVLVDPAKTITIPLNEWSKGRTVAMKIACINPNPIGVHVDESLIEQADREFNEYTIQQMEESLKNKSFEEASIQEEIPDITLSDLKKVTEALRSRIVKF